MVSRSEATDGSRRVIKGVPTARATPGLMLSPTNRPRSTSPTGKVPLKEALSQRALVKAASGISVLGAVLSSEGGSGRSGKGAGSGRLLGAGPAAGVSSRWATDKVVGGGQ